MAFIEDVSKRSQKEKHFYDAATNKWRAELSIADLHYKDDTDTWQDVDESLVADTGGFDKKCDTTRHIFRIASGGNRRWYPRRNVAAEYVDITGIQYWGNNQWRSINLPAAVWKSNGAEWDMANLCASITNTWRSIKADFILKDSTAPTRLRFAITLVGLTYNHTTGELTSTTDGLVWGYIRKPTGYDANGNINNLNVTITSTYDGTYIEWSADTTGKVFPITIDPTFTDGEGGDVNTACDVMLKGDDSSGNYGTATNAMFSNNPPWVWHPLYKHTLTSLVGKSITSADLYLYHAGADGGPTATISFARILSANSGWTETGATWDHAVEATVEWAGGQNGCGVSGTDYSSTEIGSLSLNGTEYEGKLSIVSLDLTEFSLMVSSNQGIVGYTSYGSTAYQHYSSDDVTTSTRPKLIVEYTTLASSSKTAFLKGQATTSSNKPAFLRGGGVIVNINHDTSTNLTDATNYTTSSGADISITSGAALVGTTNGLQILMDDTTADTATKSGLNDTSNKIRYRFYIDPNSITVGSGTRFGICYIYNTAGDHLVALRIEYKSATDYYLRLDMYKDDGTAGTSRYATLSDAVHYVEIYAQRESSDGAADGNAAWWLDGAAQTSVSGIDNYTRWAQVGIFRVGGGVNDAVDAGTSGTFYIDEIIANNDGSEIGPVTSENEASDSSPAYLKGTYAFEVEWAVVTTPISTGGSLSEAKSAYATGRDSCAGIKSAFIWGQTATSDNNQAFLQGQASVQGSKPSYIHGQQSTQGNKPAFMRGQATYQHAKPAYLKASAQATSNKPAYLAGAAQVQSSSDAYLSGGIIVQAQKNAYMNATGNTFAGNKPAFLKGQTSEEDQQPAYLCGSSSAAAQVPNFTRGQSSYSGSKPSFAGGVSSSSGWKNAYLQASASTGALLHGYTAGKAAGAGSKPAYLKGGVVVQAHTDAYLEGIAASARDNSPAYLKGQAHPQANRPAYTKGSASTTDNSPAYLQGQAASLDNQPAYLNGNASYLSLAPAFLMGKATVITEITAFLSGGVVQSDAQSAYMAVNAKVSSIKSAYLETSGGKTSSSAAYLKGASSTSSNKPAYLKSSYAFEIEWAVLSIPPTQMIETSSHLDAFVQGAVSISDQSPAYLSGGVIVSDHRDAYLKGRASVEAQAPAYTRGSMTTVIQKSAFTTGCAKVTTEKSAFISGGIITSDTNMAYLKGQASILGQKSAYAEGYASNISAKSAYTKGRSNTAHQKGAYLAGGLYSSDYNSAYLGGKAYGANRVSGYVCGNAATVTGVKPVYTCGKAEGIHNRPAYTRGASSASGGKYAYLRAWNVSGNTVRGYIRGKAATESSSDAYLKGSIGTSALAQAYLKGQAQTSSVKSGFIPSGNSCAGTKPAYLKGTSQTLHNSTAYLRGSSYATYVVPAYLRGRAGTAGTCSAFLSSISSNASSKTAYIEGTAPGFNFKHAYLAGILRNTKPAYLNGTYDFPGLTTLWSSLVEDVEIGDNIVVDAVVVDDTLIEDVAIDSAILEDVDIDSYLIDENGIGDTQNG